MVTHLRDCGCIQETYPEHPHLIEMKATCQDHQILFECMFLHDWGGHEECCDGVTLRGLVADFGRQAVLDAFLRQDPRRFSYVFEALEILGL